MNPLLSAWLGALIRALIGPALTWVALRIGLDEGDATVATVAVTGVALNVAWVLWTKYRDRLRFLTALDMPGGTPERTVESMARLAPPSAWERR